MKSLILVVACALALSACATLPPPVTVIAAGETAAVGPERAEALGDPTLWKGGMGPAETGLAGDGFLAATGRSRALVIHDLRGVAVQQVEGVALADIDVSAVPLEDSYAVVIGGSERVRDRTRVALYRLDRGAGQTVRRWGEIETDLSQPRGFCMRQVAGVLRAAMIDRRGEVRQLEISEGPDGEPVGRETRRYRISEAGAGCAIDPISGLIYFSHARNGFWRSAITPSAEAAPVRLVDASRGRLPGSRGVVFLTHERGRYLASLDEDHAAFSVWRLHLDDLTWLGRVAVRERAGGRVVRNRAGLDAYGGALGPFGTGVAVVQDQADDGSPNLKLVDWSEVWRALAL